jgi:MFS family permease
MRTILSALLVILAFQGTLRAQPGAEPQPTPDPYPAPPTQPPSPYPPPPHQPYPPQQPPPPPAGMVPQPYQYVPIQLTRDEQELLADGEISDGQHIGGVVAGLFFGFGIGQAVQGRWSDTGWIFTLGEAASITALMVGFVQSFNDCFAEENCDEGGGDGLIVAGFLGLVVFRVWEIADVIAGPPKHNRKLRELRMRMGMPQPMYTKITPYVNKSRDGGGVAGLSFRF